MQGFHSGSLLWGETFKLKLTRRDSLKQGWSQGSALFHSGHLIAMEKGLPNCHFQHVHFLQTDAFGGKRKSDNEIVRIWKQRIDAVTSYLALNPG